MAFEAPPPPEGCLTVEEHEKRLCEAADALEERGRRLLASDGRIDAASGNQLLVSAIAARKAAARLASERLDKCYSAWLVEEYRKLSGGREPTTRPGKKRGA